MRIEAAGRVIETKDGKRAPGEPFEIDDKEADWLIGMGAAKKAGGPANEGASPQKAKKAAAPAENA